MTTRIAFVLTMLAVSGCEERPGQIHFDRQSAYERILVVDEGGHRFLYFGGTDKGYQSRISLTDPNAVPAEYIRTAMLGMTLAERQERALMIGLGGGAFTRLLRRHYPQLWMDAVEIDPVVVEAAKAFFGVREDNRFHIHIEDGAEFVQKGKGDYDLIFLDAAGGAGIPEKLVSPAFFSDVREKLAEGGVVVLNLWKLRREEPAIAEDFRTFFPHTACVRTSDDFNLLLFGRNAPLPPHFVLADAARRFTEASGLSFDLEKIAQKLSIPCRARRR